MQAMELCIVSAVSFHPTFSTGAAAPFSRDILKPSAASLSWFHESLKVFPTAEEAAELPLGLWTQERSHCQRSC